MLAFLLRVDALSQAIRRIALSLYPHHFCIKNTPGNPSGVYRLIASENNLHIVVHFGKRNFILGIPSINYQSIIIAATSDALYW